MGRRSGFFRCDVSRREDVDAKKVMAVGWSLGSGVAMDVAYRKPVAGLATFSAFTSLDEIERTPIAYGSGGAVVVGDIAEVKRGDRAPGWPDAGCPSLWRWSRPRSCRCCSWWAASQWWPVTVR